MTQDTFSVGRRRLLTLAGTAPLVLAATSACSEPVAGPAADKVCRLTPQATQGPYWFDPRINRADVTEGKPGVPVRVAIAVVDGGCRPIANARVDLWHCDAAGIYSGYEGQGDDHATGAKGQTFLRGAQVTDAAGRAAFRSIWPGWYEGRTPHMHLKVFLDARTVLTAQLFVPDALSEYLYDNVPAYRRSRGRDTFNRQDGIALRGGEAMVAAVREMKDGYELALTLGVDPAADWKDRGFGPGGPMGGGPPGGPGRGPPEGAPPGGPHHEALTGEARLRAIVPGV